MNWFKLARNAVGKNIVVIDSELKCPAVPHLLANLIHDPDTSVRIEAEYNNLWLGKAEI